MSRPVVSPVRRHQRGPLAALTASAAVFGLVVFASPAHADAVIQAVGPAGPVPVDTPYTVTVTITDNTDTVGVDFALTGAAATVTAAQASASDWECDLPSGQCWNLASMPTPTSITLTITPTATGTVTTGVNALDWSLQTVIGSDTVTTEITDSDPSGPSTGSSSLSSALPSA